VLMGAEPARLWGSTEIGASVEVKKRQRRWWALLYVSWLLVCPIGLWFLGEAVLTDEPRLAAGATGILLIHGWYVVGLPALWRLRSDPRLACPHCGSQLDPNRIWQRNRCPNCVQPVLAEEPAGLAGTPPPG
jgi:hypothetical protein